MMFSSVCLAATSTLWITIASTHSTLGQPQAIGTPPSGRNVPSTPERVSYHNFTLGKTSCASLSGQESHRIGSAPAPTWAWQIYESAPFNPPELEITQTGHPLAPGLLFITPSNAISKQVTKENAVLIMTDTGQLVWNGPAVQADNFRVATFENRSILTYWTGGSTSAANIGHGYGNVTFLDTSYKEILVVCPKLGLVTNDNTEYPCEGDLHESFVTDRDTILVTAYNVTETDLSTVGGPTSGWVYDCLFFELDPRTGSILFSWSALEHLPVSDTKQPLDGTGGNQSNPFDWFHINSVVNVKEGYLLNSRHLWAMYLLKSTGEITWTLQGEDGGDFGSLPANGHFAWQHFARPHNVTDTSITISMFNNYNSGVDNGTHQSTLLELYVPLPPSKSTSPIVLNNLISTSHPIYAESQGSYTFLSNGNGFGGYGQIPIMREFGAQNHFNSTPLWSARFGPDNLVQSYRAYKDEWHATPSTTPSLAVTYDNTSCTIGYVSWDGATDISSWALFEGPSEEELHEVRRIECKGFETKFAVSYGCVQVAAVVHNDLTRSNAVCPES